MRSHLTKLFAVILSLLAPVLAQAAAFTPGNVVVYRVDGGGLALGSAGTAVFLDEYTAAGALVQSIAMPTTTVGANRALVASGNATTEGFISRSQDGQYLIVPGYDAAVGTAGVTSSTSIPRVMGRVSAAGTIDTTSSYVDASGAGNIRSATSLDGSRFWASGSTQGVRTVLLGGSGAATLVSTNFINNRQIHIFGNQLYMGSGASTLRLGTVGSGTPITTGNTTSNLPGFPTAAPAAINGYFFADLDAGVAGVDTVYVSDEGNNQVQKWCLVSGTWTQKGSAALASARGLAGTVSGSNVTLFATGGGAGTPIFKIDDTTGYNVNLTASATTIVATAGTNKAHRGIAIVPVAAGPPAPIVTSIVRAAGAENPTNDPTVNFTVTFSQSVTGVDESDFTLTTTGTIAGALVSSVTPVSGSEYTVAVTTGTGDGTIRLDLTPNGSIVNGSSTALVAPFTSGEFYTLDRTGPAVTSIVRAAGADNPTNDPLVDFTVTFNEAASNVDNGDFTVTVTAGGITGQGVVTVTPVSSTVYTVTAGTGTGDGTIRLDFTPNDASDALGNVSAVSFTTGETYTVDKTGPTVQSIVRAGANPTGAATVDFTVDFGENVLGLDASDFNLDTTGVSGVTFGTISASNPYTVTVNTGTGSGTIGIDLIDNGSVTDAVGNPLTGSFTTGEDYTIDRSTPEVSSIVRDDPNPTNANSVDFTVTFNTSVTGVDMADFAVDATGTFAGTSIGVAGSGTTWTVTLSWTAGGEGTISVDLIDNDTILSSSSSEPLGGAGLGNGDFTTGESYTVDVTGPSVQSVERASANPNPGPEVDYTVTFDESVSGVDAGDFTLTTTGSIAGATVTNVTAGPASVYTVTVNIGSGTGTIRLDVDDDDSIVDAATNPLGAGYTGGEIYTVAIPGPVNPVAAVRNGGVALSWDAVSGATSYNVYRATVAGGPYTLIASPAGTSYDDTSVTNGTRYFYVVTSVDGVESAYSAEVHAKPDVQAALGVVISQVYGAGGNTGATLKNDFIELFNRGNSTVDLSGWSVQYISATGTGAWTATNLSGTLAPGQHYLVQQAAGTGGTVDLPAPDSSGAIAMSGTAGKVALTASTTALSGGCPGGLVDLAGYGSTASCFEGAGPTPNPSAGNLNSLHRGANGCNDTNSNNTDFANAVTNPRNRAAAFTPCAFTAIGSADPALVDSGNTTLLEVELPPATSGGAVTANLTAIGGSAAQAFFDNGTNGDVTAADNIFSFTATATGSAGVKSLPVSATNSVPQAANTSIVLTITPPVETIAAVKVDTTPADTIPDRLNQPVRVQGVVTSIDFRGGSGVEYYIQDATAGIDVFSTGDFGPFTVGASVEVSGTVIQFSGLTEVGPTSMTSIAALPPITPQVVTLAQLADGVGEALEGKLVRINELTVTSGTFPAAGASGNVTITDSSGSGQLRVDSDTDIDGTTAPAGIFSLVGLVGQSDATPPHDSGYQVLPRSNADIIPRTAPSGTGSANPPSVPPGGTTLLTVNVTPGQNPASTGITVTANLTSIGLGAAVAFTDDGSVSGDSPGDGIYSYEAVVNGATSLGQKTLPVSLADAQARSGNTSILLYVQSASAPPAPANLIATPGNEQVSLTWDASLGATTYNVKRATVSGGPYTTIAAGIAATNYTDTGLSNGVTYYYVVSALSGANESGDSLEVSGKPSAPPPTGPLGKIYFVDIGQGAGTLIVSPTGKTMLVDGGPNGEGNGKVIPLLNSLGISTLDFTLVTHYHIDHEGGMTEVIQAGRLNNGIAYDNGDAPHVVPPVPTNGTGTAFVAYKNAISGATNVTRTTITPGMVIDLGGGMKVTCLAAGGSLLSGGRVYVSGTDLNSSSVSVLVQYNDFDYLVSGDLTGGGSTTTAKTPDVETFVAQMAGDIDIVQLDHHGSTTANNRRFLGMLKAEASFASIGTANTFGHPNRETVNRYLNIPVSSGHAYHEEGVPDPGNGPVHYQTEASPPTDNRTSVQFHSGASASDAGEGTLLLQTDGLVSFTMESFDDGGTRIDPSTHVYGLDGQGTGVRTNFPPTVIPSLLPAVPTAADVVTITALVNDDLDSIVSVTLNYSLNGAAQAPVTMTLGAANEYSGTIPAQPNATRVDWSVVAVAGTDTTTYPGGYFAGTTSIATLRSLTALAEPTFLEYAARISGTATSTTGNYSSTNNDDYITDGTGSLNVARTIEPDSPGTTPMTAGTTYTVAGLIGQLTGRFRLEVTPPFDGVTRPWDTTAGSFHPYTITSTGSAAVTPEVKTIAQILADGEGLEAHLVEVNNVTIVSGTVPASGGLDVFLTINDGTGTMELKIDADSDIPGMGTPASPLTITGIIQQDDFLRPFTTRYTLAPRDRGDLGGSAGGPALITIAEARADEDPVTSVSPDDFIPDLLGQTIKIRGVVTSVDFDTSGNGIEYYIQDPTGGVDIFSSSINLVLSVGDTIEVTGAVAHFNGLTEIVPAALSDITVLPAGTLPPVNLEVVTLSQLGNSGAGEAYEGRLVRVNNVTLASPPATFAANTNYNVTDATGTAQMRIDGDTAIDGTAPPSSPFSVIGVVGQFDNANPRDSGYQLFPRTTADFLAATPAAANIVASAGTPQSATISTAFATNLQATVTGGGGAPIEGIGVTFTAPGSGASGTFANGTNTTSVATNASGIATATTFTANATTGTYNVTATTTGLGPVTFALTNAVVSAAATHFTVSAPANVTVGVPFDVTVTARDGSNAVVPTYTGTVSITSSAAGTMPASYTFTGSDNGVHVFSVTLDELGNHTITASDGGITGNTSVTVDAIATSTALALSPSATFGRQPVTFTATVTSGSGTPTGTVTFFVDGAPIATRPLVDGVADATKGTTIAGTHDVHAVYSGSTQYGGSTSSTESLTVTLSPTTTVVTVSPQPHAVSGDTVTITAIITATYGPVYGVVEFRNNGTKIGSATAREGTVSLLTTRLPVGTNSLEAIYAGSSWHAGSTSDDVEYVVKRRVSTTILTPPAICTGATQRASVATVPSGTYTWGITGGTITSGQGTRAITFQATAGDFVDLTIDLSCPDCESDDGALQVAVGAGGGNPGRSLNADATADLILQDPSTGALTAWTYVNGARTGTASIATGLDDDWTAVALGDVNTDGSADVILRNHVTGANMAVLLDGSMGSLGPLTLPSRADLAWKIGGAADFNCDGNPDLIWTNTTTGANEVWLLDDSGASIGTLVLTKVDPALLRLAGSGDFTGDGLPDLVWRRTGSGQQILWPMAGSQRGVSQSLPTQTDPNYEIDAIGDFDGDGDNDLFSRHITTGATKLWQMQGTTLQTDTAQPSAGALDIAGPK